MTVEAVNTERIPDEALGVTETKFTDPSDTT
jgi:hypothetical protein